jgi:putative tryptophan/tyrosine transport system substrate-binding protein
MRRREFVIGGLSAAAALPQVATAQQLPMPVIGFLHTLTSEAAARYVTAFLEGLKEAGYLEGRDVIIEYRFADGQLDRLPALAADLVRRQVALIVASPNVATLAAKAATTTIPIIFQVGTDPVKLGIVSSFNRPGGNLTGVSQLSYSLVTKRLGLLHELVPNALAVGILADPQISTNVYQIADLQQAASALGLQPIVLNGRDIDSVFANLPQQHIDALFVTASSYFYIFHIRDQIISLAAHHDLPVIYETREFPEAGGLVSYGVDFSDVYRELAVYAGKILRGAKPADLPVEQPTKLELVINLKTAKALRLTIPSGILAIADEVIE